MAHLSNGKTLPGLLSTVGGVPYIYIAFIYSHNSMRFLVLFTDTQWDQSRFGFEGRGVLFGPSSVKAVTNSL